MIMIYFDERVKIYYYITPYKFFTPVLADGLSLESK